MFYPQFLADLLDSGRVCVPSLAEVPAAELDEGDLVLAEREALVRLESRGEAPPFSLSAARWAATRFYRACQFSVFRNLGKDAIEQEFAEPCPAATAEPTTIYSVDLVFRFLPDLVRFASSAAESDPLVQHLRNWAVDWPLSSVGLSGVSGVNVDALVASPPLLQMYIDRILAAEDTSRLDDPRIDDVAEESWGMYPELAPKMEAAIRARNANHRAAGTDQQDTDSEETIDTQE